MDYHHHQVQLHCRVCAKRMYDRRGNKKDTTYQCEPYTQALPKVFGMAFQAEEDAMVYHKVSVAPACVPFKRQWMQLHRGYHIGAV